MNSAVQDRWSLRALTLVGVQCLALTFLQPIRSGEPAVQPGRRAEVQFWSFEKLSRPAVPPAPKDGSLNPIDTFVEAKLREKGLSPAGVADRRTLIRRAYFDLIGLPPAPEKVEAFAKDADPQAWPKVIDELLAMPQYGERWGRHWLDTVRYADSGGYETDIYYRHAWRYRDYVVKSFNDDKPYDRFVQEQIAGDELWPDNLDLDPKRVYFVSEEKRRNLEARMGTGFYTLGPQIHESGLDSRKLRHEQLTDWVDTTGSVFLGLTIGCARCHRHKFDPLTQQDYYAMQAIFAGSVEVEEPLVNAMEIADWKQSYPRIVAVAEARRAYRLFEQKVKGRALTPQEKEEKRKLLENIGQAVLELPQQTAGRPSSFYDGLMEIPTVSVLGHERPELVKPVHLLERGELAQPRTKVEAGLPAILANKTGELKPLPGLFGSRKQLALWLTQPNHPLTARVMVNRIWHWHFGRGIVATPNDFGAMGQRPSHPELLDWLAAEFAATSPVLADKRGTTGAWSVKKMHRLIMHSNTYQRSSSYSTGANVTRDADNRFLWRMNRRRVEAEVLWDAVHSVSGTLNLKLGGPPVVPPLAEDEIAALRERWHWPVSADPLDHTRRGLYILVRRNFRFPMFEVFDAPVTSVSCPGRDVTTVALQALWSLNNRSVFRQAEEFAGRLVNETGERPEAWIERAWLIALARPPSPLEKQEAQALLETLARSPGNGKNAEKDAATRSKELPKSLARLPAERAAALTKLCLALYNLNEFAFVD